MLESVIGPDGKSPYVAHLPVKCEKCDATITVEHRMDMACVYRARNDEVRERGWSARLVTKPRQNFIFFCPNHR
jgi:hypothetical protein